MIVLVELSLIIIIILLFIILYIFYKKRTIDKTGTSIFETGTSMFEIQRRRNRNMHNQNNSKTETGSSEFESGTSVLETGSSEFETGSSEFESGTSVFETGSSEFESGTSVFETGSSEFETGTLGCINFELSTIQNTDCLHKDDVTFSTDILTITFSALELDNGMKVLQVSGTKEQQFHPQTVYFVKDKNKDDIYTHNVNSSYWSDNPPWYKSEDFKFLFSDIWNFHDAEIRFDSSILDFFNHNMIHETNCGDKYERYYPIRLNNRPLCLYKYENSCRSANGSSRTLYPLIRLNEQNQTVPYYPHVSMPRYKHHSGLYNVYRVYKDTEDDKFKLSVTLKYSIDDNWRNELTYQESLLGAYSDFTYINRDVFESWDKSHNAHMGSPMIGDISRTRPMQSPHYAIRDNKMRSKHSLKTN